MTTNPAAVVDLFAGPGGWSLACRWLGLREVGIELDRYACATRDAAGFATVQGDVSSIDPRRFVGVQGLIASPPCPAFSNAGRKHGRGHLDALVAAVAARDWSARPDPDPEVWLMLEVGRWWEALEPEWVALEQVPAALPVWEAYAALFTAAGYSAWSGVVNAADYGVPQTRKRAVLIASRRVECGRPPATHDVRPAASGLAPWVTMYDALGVGMTDRPYFTISPGAKLPSGADSLGVGGADTRAAIHAERAAGRWALGLPRRDDGRPGGSTPDGYRVRDWRPGSEPSATVTEKARSWVLNTGLDWKPGQGRDAAQTVPSGRPAPAFTTKAGGQWQFLVDDGATLRLTTAGALVLQGFPADYPVQGTLYEQLSLDGIDSPEVARTRRFEQIGNAVPPALAAALLRQLIA